MTTKLYAVLLLAFLVMLVKLFSTTHDAAIKLKHQQSNAVEQALRDAGV